MKEKYVNVSPNITLLKWHASDASWGQFFLSILSTLILDFRETHPTSYHGSILSPEIHVSHFYPSNSHILSLLCSNMFWRLSIDLMVDPGFFTSKPHLPPPGFTLPWPRTCTCPIILIVKSIHYFTDVQSIFLTLYILALLSRMSLHSHVPREILYILKCSAQMSLSPGSVSNSPSQKLIPSSSILPMLLSLDFYCAIFHIIHCIIISNVGVSSLTFYI